ncbi:hypothetical protein Bca52824_058019 [Brassica carinata]|uniref:Uncharacterized protein n=1 Tax=Brassica carinata TaxID=52824 RepID=A0A8X7QRN0_BRACI|nr:hypothetical protein Bca52824_058019 [Brassica carinata]
MPYSFVKSTDETQDSLVMGIHSNLKFWGKSISLSLNGTRELGIVPHEEIFFTKYTRQQLESIQKMMEPFPFISFLTEHESHEFETEFSIASEEDKKMGRQKDIRESRSTLKEEVFRSRKRGEGQARVTLSLEQPLLTQNSGGQQDGWRLQESCLRYHHNA